MMLYFNRNFGNIQLFIVIAANPIGQHEQNKDQYPEKYQQGDIKGNRQFTRLFLRAGILTFFPGDCETSCYKFL